MNNSIIETIELHEAKVRLLKQSGLDILESISHLISDSIGNGGCVYLCGNGGSAADCQHIAGELIGRFRKERKAFAAVALTTDSSVMTSIANDYSYDEIFSRQVEGLASEGDVLWAFSTSGNSKSIIKAVHKAKEQGVKVVGFTGKAGSELEEESDVCFCANCDVTSVTQEVHMLCYHIICDLVEKKLSE